MPSRRSFSAKTALGVAAARLTDELHCTGDPREIADPVLFDSYPTWRPVKKRKGKKK
jgi:hypothetical protein